MCVQMVQQKVDTVAGAVVTAMLQLSRPHETRLQEDRSAPLAETAISAAVAEANDCRRSSQLSSEKVSGASFSTCRRLQPPTAASYLGTRLAQTFCAVWRQTRPRYGDSTACTPVSSRRLQLVTCVGEGHGGASYCVNMKRIIDLIRMKEARACRSVIETPLLTRRRVLQVDAVVRERFGEPACRIFRLVLLKRQLEQKQIADEAMLPVKDTRELLYKLFKVEFVQLQEVARTADHSPSRTFYLWRVRVRTRQSRSPADVRQVDLLRVIDKMCSELYRTLSKVRARLRYEVEQESKALARLESAGSAPEGVQVSLTAEQRTRLERIRRVGAALEVSLMRLDETVLLFAL